MNALGLWIEKPLHAEIEYGVVRRVIKFPLRILKALIQQIRREAALLKEH
jgi:hypothetical protein